MVGINIGAGEDIKDDCINVDSVELPGINVIHDLNVFPWPFEDNSFDKAYCSHVLEHVNDLTATMFEIKRICRPGASVLIRVPHFSCGVSYRDPTHKRLFSYFTWDYFTDECFYGLPKFKIISRKLNFTRQTATFLNYIINPIINISPALYERMWCWIFPCAEVIVELEVTK